MAKIAADSDNYLVWSNEHRAWWKADSGYSTGLGDAGRFSRGSAIHICKKAIPSAMHVGKMSEIPVRECDIYDVLDGEMIPQCIVK